MVAHERGWREEEGEAGGERWKWDTGGEGRGGKERGGVQVNEDCGGWISYGAGSTKQGGRSGNQGRR